MEAKMPEEDFVIPTIKKLIEPPSKSIHSGSKRKDRKPTA
jgi:hypothetical protein